MTKNQAMWAITHISNGTIANLIESPKYSAIDAAVCKWIEAIASAPETAFEACENWMQVWEIIK